MVDLKLHVVHSYNYSTLASDRLNYTSIAPIFISAFVYLLKILRIKMKTMLNKYIYHSLFDKIFSLLITINLIAWGNEVNESISMGGFSSNGFIYSSISLLFTLFQFLPSSGLIIVLILILIITSLLIFVGVVIKFKKSDSLYKATLKNRYNFEESYSKLNDIQFTLDTEKRFVGAFGTLLAKMDLSDNFFTGKTIDQVFGLEESGKQIEEYTKALNGEVGRYEWMLTWNGKDYYFLISLSPLYDNLKKSVIGVIGTGQDITKLKLSEINERRLERAYNLISECNHIIFTQKNEELLYQSIVDHIVNKGGYKFVWIGLYDESNKKIVPAAQCGFGGDFLNSIELDVNCSAEDHPAVKALLSGKSFYTNNNPFENLSTNWQKEVAKYGFVSTLSLPLILEDKKLGILTIDSDKIDAFNSEKERAIFQEIADDVAYAVFNLKMSGEKQLMNLSLREKEKQFLGVFENSPVSMCLIQTDGRFVAVNKAMCNMLEYSETELLNDSIKNYMLKEDYKFFTSQLVKLFRGNEEVIKFEKRFEKKNGTVIWASAIASTLKDDKGVPQLIIGQVEDITERLLLMKRVSESEQKYKKLFEEDLTGNFVSNPDGTLVMCNNAFVNILGYDSVEEILQINCSEFWYDASERNKVHAELAKSKKLLDFEMRLKNKMGEVVFVKENLIGVFDDDGNLTQISGYIYDITKRKEAEKQIILDEERFEALFKLSQMWNNSEKKVVDYALQEIIKLTGSKSGYFHFVNEDKNSINTFQWINISADLKSHGTHSIPIDKTGSWTDSVRHRKPVIHNSYYKEFSIENLPFFHLNLHNHISIPVFQGDAIVAIAGVGNKYSAYSYKDVRELSLFMSEIWKIIERRRAEQRLEKSEKRYRSLFENATVGIYRSTIDGKIIMANPALLSMFGYDDLEDLSSIELERGSKFIPLERKIFKQKIAKTGVLKGHETIWLKKDGTPVYVKESAREVKDENGELAFYEGYAEDITNEVQNKSEIRKLSEAVEQNFTMVMITNTQGIIEYVNPRFTEVTGYSVEDAKGKKSNILKSGHTTKEEYKKLWETINSGEVWQGEFINKKKNGQQYWESATISPIKDSFGKITHFVAIKNDITEEKQIQSELVQARIKAESGEKMKENFLSQMSHEIRTPLNALLSFSEYINYELKNIEHNSEIEESLKGIESAGQRIIRTIDSIINMSELQSGTYDNTARNMNLKKEVLDKVYNEFKSLARNRNINFVYESNLIVESILSDSYALNQILNNLVDNAIKFTNEGEVKLIAFNDANYIIVQVSDTGIGIDEKYLTELFTVFSQAEKGYSRRYDGNGLGLALVKGYCDLNNILIDVKSKLNVGTTITLKMASSSCK